MVQYGQRFIDSFQTKGDPRVKLRVYAENCKPIVARPEQVTVVDAKEALPDLNAFKERWKDVPKANGTCPGRKKTTRSSQGF